MEDTRLPSPMGVSTTEFRLLRQTDLVQILVLLFIAV